MRSGWLAWTAFDFLAAKEFATDLRGSMQMVPFFSRLPELVVRDLFSLAFHRKQGLSTASAQSFASLSPHSAAWFID